MRLLLIAFAGCVVAACSQAAPEEQIIGEWTALTPMPEAAADCFRASLPDGTSVSFGFTRIES